MILNEGKIVKKDEIDFKSFLMTLTKILKFIHRKQRSLLITFVFGMVAGLSYSLIERPKYVSEITFVLENNGKSKMDYASIAARFGLSLGTSANGLFSDDDNIIAFIKSRTMFAKTLRSQVTFNRKKQMLIERYLHSSGLTDAWLDNPRLSKLKFNTNPENSSILEDSVITLCYKTLLKKCVSAGKPNKEQNIISVKTVTTDELFSKRFNEELIKNVTTSYIEMQTKKSQDNVNILRRQIDSIRLELNETLLGVAYTNETNLNPNPAFQHNKVPAQNKLIEIEMYKAALEELVKNLALSELALRKETPLIQVIDASVLPLEKKKVGKILGMILGSFIFTCLFFLYHGIRKYLSNLLQQ